MEPGIYRFRGIAVRVTQEDIDRARAELDKVSNVIFNASCPIGLVTSGSTFSAASLRTSPSGLAEQRYVGDMADKRPKLTHNPSQRSIQRWENEGGATKDVRAKRPDHLKKQDIAANLAGQVIDGLADRSATSEERESRKRRLLKGPKEFRNMRRDDRK